ncbi:DUF4376 domain-containing protein [Cellvibrio sp. QJXJ]|uniref:DUF4376 domain-containing protein n=1 Tax=Cellvibrio sp. QJXJ TaxID=2964606 RepID=UPI0021C40690|nr:DUF4376 domain-containing protein [Cellvibrio sp. QJXJ]UUA73107.1 DUF4376 domain-containing protein [Cellvibrio sp. QJXJ]
MTIYFNAQGFICDAEIAEGFTELVPQDTLQIPKFVSGGWVEGLVRRAFVYDEDNFYSGVQDVDPRTINNYTTEPIPGNLMLPRWESGRWVEGLLSLVSVVDDDGYFVETLTGLDPRNMTANHIYGLPPSGFVVPRFVDESWVEGALPVVVYLNDGFISHVQHSVDPRQLIGEYCTNFPPVNFIAPRFVNNEWIETAIEHALAIDADGYFLHDIYNFDARKYNGLFTTVLLGATTFRRPRFVNGEWIDDNPVTEAELLGDAKNRKLAEISVVQKQALASGVAFEFMPDTEDVVQTRDDRDLINISGVATNAMILKQAGIDGAVIEFRAESNTSYMLTPEQAIALGVAVAEHSKVVYAKAWQLKDQIANAGTLEEVEAVGW